MIWFCEVRVLFLVSLVGGYYLFRILYFVFLVRMVIEVFIRRMGGGYWWFCCLFMVVIGV